MNTEAHHSGKGHSTHGFTRASVTHGRYTQKHNHKAQHSYTQSQLQKHSTGTHGVTATEHNTIQNLLNNGEHNTNTDTGGWTSCKVRK